MDGGYWLMNGYMFIVDENGALRHEDVSYSGGGFWWCGSKTKWVTGSDKGITGQARIRCYLHGAQQADLE